MFAWEESSTFFAFVLYLILFSFLIREVTLAQLSIFKNVYLPNLYRVCSGRGINSTGMHFLLNCQQQPGKWDYECQTREKCSLADASQAARCPVGQEADCYKARCYCRVGGRKCFLCCSLSGQILACETFVMSNMQFLTWNLKIMKNK